jgi:small nuclear ribonucleoprotein (snRNP)-like protein
MNKEEVATMIQDRYADGSNLSVTRVICKNDVTYYGYFSSFSDYSELMEKNCYRFIPRNSSKAFREDFTKKGIHDTSFSIIIKGEDILAIEFVMPMQVEVY